MASSSSSITPLVHAAGVLSLFAAACSEPAPAVVGGPNEEARPAPPVVASVTSTTVRSASPVESAAPPAPSRPAVRRYELRYEDVGLPELTRAISEITGKRFVLSGPLPAVKASLHAPDPVTAEEAYRAFLTVLASNGLTVVERGRFLAIVPSPGFGPRK